MGTKLFLKCSWPVLILFSITLHYLYTNTFGIYPLGSAAASNIPSSSLCRRSCSLYDRTGLFSLHNSPQETGPLLLALNGMHKEKKKCSTLSHEKNRFHFLKLTRWHVLIYKYLQMVFLLMVWFACA